MIDYSNFYMLEEPGATRPLRLKAQQEFAWRNSFELYSGEFRPPEPVLLKAFMGGQLADFLWASSVFITCISQRVLGLLKANGFTGWDTYPVEAYGRRGEPLPGYHGFAVKSWAGKINLAKSPIIDKPPLVPGADPYRVYRGLYFDEKNWDGSDVFRLAAGETVITGRVKDVFKKAKVTNILLTPLDEFEMDVTTFTESNSEYWSR
ncbi:MAG: hypothetical protein HY673_06595 [Chloroflexi bacterium]|nr:hypothetical protein [Chloroflexota bacterium]